MLMAHSSSISFSYAQAWAMTRTPHLWVWWSWTTSLLCKGVDSPLRLVLHLWEITPFLWLLLNHQMIGKKLQPAADENPVFFHSIYSSLPPGTIYKPLDGPLSNWHHQAPIWEQVHFSSSWWVYLLGTYKKQFSRPSIQCALAGFSLRVRFLVKKCQFRTWNMRESHGIDYEYFLSFMEAEVTQMMTAARSPRHLFPDNRTLP